MFGGLFGGGGGDKAGPIIEVNTTIDGQSIAQAVVNTENNRDSHMSETFLSGGLQIW